MAKITVVGDAAVVTSTLKAEDIQTLKKYRPQALILMGGEDGKEPIFAIDMGSKAQINGNGIVFTGASRDDAKAATLTVTISGVTGDVKEWVADKFGEAIAHLNELEAQIPGALDEVRANKRRIMENIVVSA